MNRYPFFVKYLVVFLVFLHALAGGHIYCCVHLHESEADSFLVVRHSHPIGHTHDRSHHESTSDQLCPTCSCQNDPCDHDHECSGAGQPVISTQRSIDENAKLFPIPCFHIASIVSLDNLPITTGFHDTVSFSSFSPPLRLHLLYRSLLI